MLLILAHEKVKNSLCYMYRAKPNEGQHLNFMQMSNCV